MTSTLVRRTSKPNRLPKAARTERAVLDALGEQIALLDRDGLMVLANASWLTFAALNLASGASIPPTDTGADYLGYWRDAEHAHVSGAAAVRAAIEAVLTGLKARSTIALRLEGAGQTRALQLQISELPDGALLVQTDLGARQQADTERRIAAAAFESGEGKMVTDLQGRIVQVNQAFCDITGYARHEAVGKTPAILSSGRHGAPFYAAMWRALRSCGSWQGEVWNRRKNGDVYPERLHICGVYDAAGGLTHFVASLSDITVSKAASDEIRTLAFYDPLTRLANRRLLLERLEQALSACASNGRSGALLFLDLDNFKTLNDTLGHATGDLLLKQVALRLQDCVRHSDLVARLGSDEFVLLLDNLSADPCEAGAEATKLATKIMNVLGAPYMIGQHACRSTQSIGIALFREAPLARPEQLLQQADIAMYQAKQAGRNGFRFFDPCMQLAINERARLEQALRQALELQQFELHYQVQVDYRGHASGAEALIRWRSADGSMIAPASFIALAEETGLILPIGSWVIDQACAQLHAWRAHDTLRHLELAVNVSARQFHQDGFCEQVLAAIARHDIDPTLLKLELTEGILVDNIEDTVATLQRLRQIGVRFSLDDFGTGYSSLQYLKRLPLDQLKIDQSFVRDLVSDCSDQAIVRTIIAMADSLGLEVIAEGVESEAQRLLLEQLGCCHYQGYLFSRALAAAPFVQLVASAPAWPACQQRHSRHFVHALKENDHA